MRHKIDDGSHHWLCKNALSPWPCGAIGCPFILSRNNSHLEQAPNTLIILQDYGIYDNEFNLEVTTKNLKPFFKKKLGINDYISGDTTLQKLYNSISAKTKSGDIAITNAVWALRTSQSKTGYLGTNIHKTWFKNWLKVIKEFQENGGVRVIFCGEWARFENNRENQKILDGKTYIERWGSWADSCDIDLSNHKFEVWLVRHPSAPSSEDSVWLSTGDEIDFIDQTDLSKIIN